MQPRPPDSWPPAREMAEPGPSWRPPQRGFEREVVDRGHHHGGDYGGHYAPNSQFGHPEKQRQHRQPDPFWFTSYPHPPPPPPPHHHHHRRGWSHWQSHGHPPPHWGTQQEEEEKDGHPPPHWSTQQEQEERDGHPPPHWGTQQQQEERDGHPPPHWSTQQEQEERDGHPPPHWGTQQQQEEEERDGLPPLPPTPSDFERGPYLPPPNPPLTGGPEGEPGRAREDHLPVAGPLPSLTSGPATERVSAVDLIKGYRTDDGEETSHRENREPSEEAPPPAEGDESREMSTEDPNPDSPPPPPWFQREGGGGERDRGQITTGGSAEREGETEGEEEGEKYEDSFVAEVRRFVQRNREMFDLVSREELVAEPCPTLHNFTSDASFKYAEPEGLEYHMQVLKPLRRQSFFKLVQSGDVVQGHVVTKRYSGLVVQITSFVNSHKYRELSDLSIRGIVPFDNLADDPEKSEDVMRDMQLNDVVQAVVVQVDLQEETLLLSFCGGSDFPGVETDSLGYRTGRRPDSPRPSVVRDGEFLERLERDQGFINPEAGSNLHQLLGLPAPASFRHTLLKDLQTAEYAEEDFAEPLRKAQRFKWSMKTVAVGVGHFKSGKHEEARKVLNHALDIDPSNVEGLVARGALLATTGQYKEGIADFHKALSLKNTHKNARNYLVETQVVYGKQLEERGKIDSAMACYREALDFDPGEETAKARLQALTVAIETKTARLRERERQEEEEQEKLARVRRVIEKEKKKRLRERKSKRKKRRSGESRKHKKRSKKKTSKKAYYSGSSSSSEEESTESESESEDEDDSRRRKGRKRERRKERRNKKSRRKSVHDSSSDATKSDEKTAAAASRKRSKYSSADESNESSAEERREKRGKGARKTRSPSPRKRYSSFSSSSWSDSRD